MNRRNGHVFSRGTNQSSSGLQGSKPVRQPEAGLGSEGLSEIYDEYCRLIHFARILYAFQYSLGNMFVELTEKGRHWQTAESKEQYFLRKVTSASFRDYNVSGGRRKQIAAAAPHSLLHILRREAG